jgi:hypothetical protein
MFLLEMHVGIVAHLANSLEPALSRQDESSHCSITNKV